MNSVAQRASRLSVQADRALLLSSSPTTSSEASPPSLSSPSFLPNFCLSDGRQQSEVIVCSWHPFILHSHYNFIILRFVKVVWSAYEQSVNCISSEPHIRDIVASCEDAPLPSLKISSFADQDSQICEIYLSLTKYICRLGYLRSGEGECERCSLHVCSLSFFLLLGVSRG